jgi:hypothetical protein
LTQTKTEKERNGKIAIELFVARVTRQGEVRMAKPCSDCIRLLKSTVPVHVERVHYTNENGEWITESLEHLSSNHVSMKKRLFLKLQSSDNK